MGINLRARGYDTVEERGNFERLPPDGYICRIVDAQLTRSRNGNEMLKNFVDISEGKHAGYFKKLFDKLSSKHPEAKWPSAATMYQNLFDSDGKVNGGLKTLLKAIENSNYGFTVNVDDFDERTLRNKIVGVIFGDEEYEKNDGSTGVVARAKYPRSAETIREGDFKVPALKKLDSSTETQTDSPPPTTQQKSDAFDLEDPPF